VPFPGGLAPLAWELRDLTWIPFSVSGGGKVEGRGKGEKRMTRKATR